MPDPKSLHIFILWFKVIILHLTVFNGSGKNDFCDIVSAGLIISTFDIVPTSQVSNGNMRVLFNGASPLKLKGYNLVQSVNC